MQCIIYPTDEGIAVIHPAPACDYPIEEIARKDVPQGAPYRFINATDLPEDRVFRGAWEADFSDPDGHGDPAGWWEQEQARQAAAEQEMGE